MIKINLLAEGRRPVVARKAKPSLSLGGLDPSVIILGLGILTGIVVGGGWWFMVAGDLADIDAQVAQAKREVEELRPIIEEVEAFKAKQADLTRKIEVIKDLKSRQHGPVHIMDEVSRALPDLLWLSNLTLRGDLVTIKGTAFNTNAIAAFIENLNRVPEFREPEDDGITQSKEVYNFGVHFRFTPKKPPAAEEGAPAEQATPKGG